MEQWYHQGKKTIASVNYYVNWCVDMGAIPRVGDPWTPQFAMAGPGENLPPLRTIAPKGEGSDPKPRGAKTEGPPFPNRTWKDETRSKAKGGGDRTQDESAKKPKVDHGIALKCTACGRSGHDASKCVFNMTWGQHPDRNTTNTPFADSAVGKRWKEKGKDVLPHNMTLDGSTFTCVPTWAAGLTEEEFKAK